MNAAIYYIQISTMIKTISIKTVLPYVFTGSLFIDFQVYKMVSRHGCDPCMSSDRARQNVRSTCPTYNMETQRMTDLSSAANNYDFCVRRLAPTRHRHVTRTQNNRAYAESRLFRIFLLFHLSFEKRRNQNHQKLPDDENVNQKAVIISTRNNPYWIYMLQSNIKWIWNECTLIDLKCLLFCVLLNYLSILRQGIHLC